MPVITPPFNVRRIQQHVLEGTGVGEPLDIPGVTASTSIVSVLSFASGVPTDVTSEYVAADGGLDKADGTDETGNTIVVLLVLKAATSGPSGPEPVGLQVQITYGTAWDDEPIPYEIDEWLSPSAFLYAVLSFPMSTSDPVAAVVTSQFEVQSGAVVRTSGDTGMGPSDDDDNRALIVIWSRPGYAYDLTVVEAAGTSSGVDVSVSGVESSDTVMGALAFEDETDVVDRASEYVAGTDEFTKSSGTDETGNALVFFYGDPSVDSLDLTVSVGAGGTDGAVTVSGMAEGDEVVAVIYTNSGAVDPTVMSTTEYDIVVVSGGVTITPVDSGAFDYTGVSFIVLWKDLT